MANRREWCMMADAIRVLYVDDEPPLLEIGKLFLEKKQGVSVDCVLSGSEALSRIAAGHYDAVVSDYQMPGMDGIALLKKVRAQDKNLPFILFTGRGREEIVIEALNNGADFYIQKGGDPKSQFAELAHKIKSAVDHHSAEKRAKDTERRLYDIFNFLPDATLAIDTGGKVMAWNQAIEEMTGVPARDMLGKGNYEYAIPFYGERRPVLIDLVSIPDEELTRGRYAVIKKEGDLLIAETTLPRPMGRYSILLGKASLLYDDEGTIIGAIESIRDITEQKRAEEELRKARDEYVHLLENIHDVYYRSDTEGRLILASRSLAKDLGYDDISECLYKNIADTFYANPGERRIFLEEVYRNGSVSDYEVTLKKKDGTLISIATCSYLYFDESGNVLGVAGTWRNITERKDAEAALQESRRQLNAMATNIPGVVYRFCVNPDGTYRFDYISERSRQILGLENDMATFFERVTEGIVPEERERFLSSVQHAIGTKTLWEFDGWYVKPSGKKIWFSAVSSPVMENNQLIFDGVIFDNTDRKRAEEELLRKNEELSASYEQIAATEEELRANLDELTRQELALMENETRYREFFTISRDSVFITSPEGKWIDFNDAILEMFGYESREEMFEVPVRSIYVNPEERSAFLSLIERDGYVKEYPLRLKQKEGTVIDTLITAGPVRNPDGSLKAFIGTIRNVTAWKRTEENAKKTHEELEASYEQLSATEEELRQNLDEIVTSQRLLKESEEKYRTVFENTGTAMVVIEENTIISLANTGFANLSGFSKDAIEGKKSWTEFVVKEDLERMLAQHQLRRQNREEALTHYEFRVVTKSGDIHTISLSIGVIPGTKKSIASLLDITERKRAEKEMIRKNEELHAAYEQVTATEEELRQNLDEIVTSQRLLKESEEKYRTVFENTGTAMVVIEENTIISLANTVFANLCGFSKDDIEGKKSWTEFVVKEDRERMLALHRLRRQNQEEALTHYEFRFVTKSGDIRHIFLTIDVIPGTKKSVASLMDITERKRMEDALALASQKLNLLSGITRHDILNQLTALKGYLELSRENVNDPVLSDFISKEERIAGIIVDQITFTRDYQDLGVNAPAWQNVITVVGKAVKDLPLRDVRVDVDRTDPEVFADPLLERVFYNLVDNALMHGGEQMTGIRISSHEQDTGLVITCEDDGVGISEGDKKHLFERGFGRHTGLGLFLSREILSITGITITETGEPGKGARFEIAVPKEMYRFSGQE